MPTPPNLKFCKVIGKFQAFVSDSFGVEGDLDDLPDFIPMTGSGTITADIGMAFNTDIEHKSILFSEPFQVSVNENGVLSQGGREYIMLLVPDAPITPSKFTYTIELVLNSAIGNFPTKYFGPLSFEVVADATIDITDLV